MSAWIVTLVGASLSSVQPDVLPAEAYMQPVARTGHAGDWREPRPARPPARPLAGAEAAAPTAQARQPGKLGQGDVVEDTAGLSVRIQAVFVEGATLVDPQQLAAAAQPFLGKPLGSGDLRRLLDAMTTQYIEAGYLNSGVVVPDQTLKDGVLRLQAIEGSLEEVRVRGLDRLRKRYITRRLEPEGTPGTARALHAPSLQERIAGLQSDPRLRQVRGRLEPGSEPGKARLDLDVKERDPFSAVVAFSNHASPAIGDSLRQIQMQHLDFTGVGDVFQAGFGETEGANFYSVSYQRFLGHDPRKTLTIFGGKAASGLVTPGLLALGVRSETDSVGVNYRKQLVDERRLQRAVEAGFFIEDNRTSVGGVPFSFLGTSPSGKSKTTVARLAHDLTRREGRRAWNWRTSLDIGVDLDVGSITKGAEPDGQFWIWRNSFTGVQYAPRNAHQLFLRTTTQFTDDALLPQQRFLIGGHRTVRGYRENQLATDQGVVSSLEYRIPMGKVTDEHSVYFVPFADYGRGWNVGAEPAVDELGSVGLGLRAQAARLSFELFWGHAFERAPTPAGHDLQDDGIHFLVSWRLF